MIRKYEALIFDLFGTLVYPVAQQEHRKKLIEMALALAISPDEFIRHWTKTADARMKGTFKNYRENIEHICGNIGTKLEESRLIIATEIWFVMGKSETVPRADAVSVLSHLKSEGYKIGLISDCSRGAVELWEHTPFPSFFDATVFSCLVGFTKPDPRIYSLALQQLNTEPRNCIYVGDGGSRELTGARQAGMQAVLLRVLNENKADMYSFGDESWDGPVITSLSDIFTLLK